LDARLPAHVEVSALVRAVNGAGGFATVLEKGEREAGTILVVIAPNGANARVYERMPQLDGTRKWTFVRKQDSENKQDFGDYLDRRKRQDPDLWVVELDIVDGERFIGLTPDEG